MADILGEQVLGVYNDLLAGGSSEDEAQLGAQVFQYGELLESGADPGVMEALERMIRELGGTLGGPFLQGVPPPASDIPDPDSFLGISTPEIVNRIIAGIRQSMDGALDKVLDVTESIKEQTVGFIAAAVPDITEIALGLHSLLEDTLGLVADALSNLDDLALALGTGVAGGIASAADDIGGGIAGALGETLLGFLGPLGEDMRQPRSSPAMNIELGPDA